jgi:short-subunit dehydrogenase
LPTAKEVADYGYSSMIKGRTVAIHGMMNYIMSNSIRFIPRALVLKVSRKILGKS